MPVSLAVNPSEGEQRKQPALGAGFKSGVTRDRPAVNTLYATVPYFIFGW